MTISLHDTFKDQVLAYTDMLAYAEDAREETEILSFDTRALLETITAPFDSLLSDASEDFSDCLADFDALLDRHDL